MSMNQEQIIERIVRQEVLLNMSHLVGHLIDCYSYEDLLQCSVKDDHEQPVCDWVRNANREELEEFVVNMDICASLALRDFDLKDAREKAIQFAGECGEWYEYREWLDLEPAYDEALEHWAVTDWLAEQLEKEGEMVARDFYGIDIWGRTCSGQSIENDGVIQRIAERISRV